MNKFNKKIIYIVILIVIIIPIYYFFTKEDEYIENNTDLNILLANKENAGINDNVENNEKDIKEKIVIYITGAVKKEGVYEMEKNSRISDCIEKAEGLTEEADLKDINLAYLLEDGMKIYIPKKGEDSNKEDNVANEYISKDNIYSLYTDTKVQNNQKSKVNINTATQTELETLPGIGPSIALNIINYRKENGKFNSIEDIKKVSGIGDSKYKQIKDLIKV